MRVTIFIRLLLTVSCGFIFFAVGLWAVRRFLPADQQLSQTLCFCVSDKEGVKAGVWDQFAEEQKQYLLKLAESEAAGLARYCHVDVRSDEPRIIFRLRCPAIMNMKVADGFHRVISAYFTCRQARQAEISRRGRQRQSSPADWIGPAQLARLKHYSASYVQKKQELSALQIECNRLLVETVDLKDQRGRGITIAPRGMFADFIRPHLEAACVADPLLKQALSAVHDVRGKIADVEFRASRGETADPSKQMQPKPKELDRRCALLEQEIELRYTLLTDRLKQRLWPEYEIKLENQIALNYQRAAANLARRQTLEQELEQLTEQMAADRPMTLEQLKQKQDQWAEPISVRLEERLTDFSRSYPFSRLQLLLLAVFTVVGLVIGLVMPAGMPSIVAKTPLIRPLPAEPDLATEPLLPRSPISGLTVPVVPVDLEKDHPTVTQVESPAGGQQHYGTVAELMKGLFNDYPCPVVLLGGPEPKEVSARLAVNLAIALTVRRKRVLLVEADQATKDIADIFELPDSAGFFEWRRGEAWISRAAQKTQLTGLSVMAAGIPSAEQQTTQPQLGREAHRWANLANQFDVVLLYSPAALAPKGQSPAQVGAAQLLDLADAALLMTRAAQKGPQEYAGLSEQVAGMVGQHKVRLLGIIAWKG